MLGDTEQTEVDVERVREQRIVSARKCSAWRELDPGDLVQRGRFFVHAASDEVFHTYRGETFNSSGGIAFGDQQPLCFTVEDGKVYIFEQQPGTWSDRVYQQERARAGAR
jgi:hypothetical protein